MLNHTINRTINPSHIKPSTLNMSSNLNSSDILNSLNNGFKTTNRTHVLSNRDHTNSSYDVVLNVDMSNQYTPMYFLPYMCSALMRYSSGSEVSLAVEVQNFPYDETTQRYVNFSF